MANEKIANETPSTRQLAEEGFVVLHDFMSAPLLDEIRSKIENMFALEGDQAGSEFKQEPGCRRLANLANKGEVFRHLIVVPTVLELVGQVLGSKFKLSSLNARSANPKSSTRQPLHADMGAVADKKGYWVCNSVWMLDDFTPENGAIRMVPGTHRLARLPEDVLDDPIAPHPQEVLLTGRAGSVAIMNAHMWHGALDNCTDHPRRALHAFYARWDKPQQQHQKSLLHDSIQEGLSPELRRVLALDDSLNDELSGQKGLRRSGFLR